MEALDHKQFQALSQCEAYAAAAMAKAEIEQAHRTGFETGVAEAYKTINKGLDDAGHNIEFTYEINN